MTRSFSSLSTVPLRLLAAICITALPALSQVRGVYPLGMSATNSGVTPETGISYVNQFLFYSRDQAKGPNGEVLATGQNSVMMDMNSLVWVSKRKIDFLGGPLFSMSATIPIANNSLTSDVEGGISGGGGLADSYYQPFILGWRKKPLIFARYTDFWLLPVGSMSAQATMSALATGLMPSHLARPSTSTRTEEPQSLRSRCTRSTRLSRVRRSIRATP